MIDRSRARRLGAVLVAFALMTASACGDDDGAAGDGDASAGPELSGAAAAPTCLEGDGDGDAVLLVPGTGLTAEQAWAQTMGATLADDGYAVCMVDLVETATGDIQRSAEHVVAAVRSMADDGHDDIAIVGFSQGALAARWALAWWPDTRDVVTDLVSIAGPHGGAAGTAPLCADACAAALHQMTAGSDFLTALDAAWSSLTDAPALTLVASEVDSVVAVDEAGVQGSSTILVQDVCPGHVADHVELLADPVTYAVVVDALSHGGPADLARLDATDCDAPSLAADDWDAEAITNAAFGAILGGVALTDEPALAPYAS